MTRQPKPPAGPDNIIIAANLRSALARQNLSRAQLSELTAKHGYPISAAQLSRYAAGEKAMDVDEIRVVTSALDMTFGGLFDGIDR